MEDFAKGAKQANDLLATLGKIPAYLNSFRPAVAEGVARVNADIALRQGMTPDAVKKAQEGSYGLDFRNLGGDVPLPPPRPGRFPTAEHEPRAGRAAAEPTDPVETFVDQLEKTAAASKAEADNFGKSNVEKAVAIDLAKAFATAEANGSKVTDEQANRIRSAATATAEYKDKIAELTAAQQRAAETAKYFGSTISDAISSAIVDGTKLTDVLKNIEKSILRNLISGAVNGTGPFALLPAAAGATGAASAGGIFGALLSAVPKFAAGGMAAPGLAMVGEKGPELVRFGAPAMVTPNNQLGGMGGDVNYTHAPTYQITGVNPQQVLSMIGAYDAESQRNFSMRAKQARMRGF